MQVEELKKACEDALKRPHGAVILVLPWQSKGEGIRLCRTCGPIGEILCCADGETTTARFEPQKILDWLNKHETRDNQ